MSPLWNPEHVRREGTRLFPPLVPATLLLVAWGLDGTVDAIALEPARFTAIMGVFWTTTGIGLMAWGILHQTLRGTDPNPFNTTSVLVTDGPYRFSRNPIYAADLCIQTGIALLLGWEWGLILLPVSWLLLRVFVIRNEERFLAEEFGEEYEEYRRRVRRWF